MGMMDAMMNGMIKALPPEEREELMLKMMPEMMKGIDITKIMPDMLREVGQLPTLFSVYIFLSKAVKDEELKEILKEALLKIKEKMPEMMKMMQPVMQPLMEEKMMPAMLEFMSPMVPMMKDMMPAMLEKSMIPKLKERPEIKENMLEMMQAMFSHCSVNMVPLIEKEDRIDFIKKFFGFLTHSASSEMSSIEKNSFIDESIQIMKESIRKS
jgi:hypothetical protein